MRSHNIFFCLVALFLCSCRKSESPSPTSTVPWDGCIHVTDIETGEPLEMVSINWMWACCCVQGGLTDSAGMCCQDWQDQNGVCHSLGFSKAGYLYETFPSLATDFQLQKTGYVNIHIINTSPALLSDSLYVTIPGNSQFHFFGSNIDTTFVEYVDPRLTDITYYLNHQEYTLPVTFCSDSTVNVLLSY